MTTVNRNANSHSEDILDVRRLPEVEIIKAANLDYDLQPRCVYRDRCTRPTRPSVGSQRPLVEISTLFLELRSETLRQRLMHLPKQIKGLQMLVGHRFSIERTKKMSFRRAYGAQKPTFLLADSSLIFVLSPKLLIRNQSYILQAYQTASGYVY